MPIPEGCLTQDAIDQLVGRFITSKIAFYGVTPVTQQATAAAGTDAATTQTLANALRTMARNLGLMA